MKIVGLLVLAILSAACGGADSEIVVAAPSTTMLTTAQTSGWEAIPESPLTPRSRALSVWTGSEVVVLGGEPTAWCPPTADCLAPDYPPLSDGAAFDPATQRWRTIAESPLALNDLAYAVVSGEFIFVLTAGEPYRPDTGAGLLRYSIVEDSWEPMSEPWDDLAWYQIAGAGEGRVVAFSASDEQTEFPDYVFEPTTMSWIELPPDPLSPSFDRSVVVAGDDLYLFARDLVPNPGSEAPALVRSSRLDLLTGTWSAPVDSEILGGWDPMLVGDLIVFAHPGEADGGQVNNWGRAYPYGGVYDTAGSAWLALPELQAERAVVSGVIGRDTGHYRQAHGHVLDLDFGKWVPVPALPGGDEILDRSVVGAGRDLFVFGGEYWGNPDQAIPGAGSAAGVIGDGYLWTPDG